MALLGAAAFFPFALVFALLDAAAFFVNFGGLDLEEKKWGSLSLTFGVFALGARAVAGFVVVVVIASSGAVALAAGAGFVDGVVIASSGAVALVAVAGFVGVVVIVSLAVALAGAAGFARALALLLSAMVKFGNYGRWESKKCMLQIMKRNDRICRQPRQLELADAPSFSALGLAAAPSFFAK